MLSDDDLYRNHHNLVELKKQTYDKLFERCVQSVKLASKIGELMCVYKVPSFVFGAPYPTINIEYCSKYIIKKLLRTNKHIKANFIEPDIIFIDWRRDSLI